MTGGYTVETNDMRPSKMLLLMAAGACLPHLSLAKYRRQLPTKPCVNCGKPKQHNNSFCSAECSKEYKTNAKSTTNLGQGQRESSGVSDADVLPPVHAAVVGTVLFVPGVRSTVDAR